MLTEQIANDLKEAMRAKNETTLSTLRMLKSALKNKQIDLMHELSDEEVLEVIKSQVKQLKDAIDQFESGGRSDLAEGNRRELEVLKAYLPAELSDEELSIVVKEALTASGATSKADMGKAMGFVMKAVAGRADGTRVKTLIETLLGAFVLAVVSNVFVATPASADIGLLTVPTIGVFDVMPLVEMGLRLLRVMFVFAGLFSLLEIMRGSVQMAITSRTEARGKAEEKIMGGFINTGVVIVLFFATTAALNLVV